VASNPIRHKGFTLVELLVVVTIIVVVSAASIPMGLSYVRHYKITGAAQGVAAQAQRARSQAVKLNSSRGVLLNFNYPQPGQYQYTSLDPDPMTGNWDGDVYPENPGVFEVGSVAYGTVPAPPANIIDPDVAAGIQSPHGTPVDLPLDLGFDDGERNALLFRADGSVAAVNAGGPAGPGVLVQDGNDWLVTVRDSTTDLTRVIRISPGGRVRLESQQP
jgi:prepilin-type N-terminal cleavage/methylation domain-containing protein